MGATTVVSNATNLIVVCSALAVGFALGNLAARRGEHHHQQQTRQQQQQEQEQEQEKEQEQGVHRPCGSTRGAKRKERVRKSEENAKGRQVKPPPPLPSSSPGEQANGNANAAAATTKHLSRRTRNRMKKLAPKDLALDAFTRVARSHVACIGSGDYEFLLLLPRKAFLAAGRFVPYAECRDRLVTLGEARRAATASSGGGGVDQLRVLYVSRSKVNPGERAREDWESKDFETARALLQRCPDLAFVYVGGSCVVAGDDSGGPAKRVEQLRHVPSILLRADAVLVLPSQAGDGHADGDGDARRRRHHRYSDFNSHASGAWARMELALAAVGQAKVYVAFRAEPYLESLCELKPGKSDVHETTRQAAEALQAAATADGGGGEATTFAGYDKMTDHMSVATGLKGGEPEGTSTAAEAAVAAAVAAETAAAVVSMAQENWVGAELNPLGALEEARVAVTAAEKSDDAEILGSIKGMRSVPNPGFAESARASLGEERAEGERELALSLLLFAVVCSQPKARATYTDAFVEDAGKSEISYRPIAVVRSPYRERFGTPRQPQVTASVLHGGAQEGQIVFLKGHGYEEALQDLSGFDMIWVISHMHLNKGWNRKVRPPRLPEERKGLFSTRSPHRPNALALSSLRVGRVDAAKGVIYVHGLDLLDGTPVLDIKPYIGYCDAFPDMKAGWLDALGSDHEEQGDFLPKFSVGATLVHTASRTESAPEGCVTDEI